MEGAGSSAAAPRMRGRPRRSRGEQKAATRARILDAAARLFAERGYRAATMEEIARAAEVSKGGLYWSFESKQELFFALLEERIDRPLRELFERVESAPVDADTAPWAGQGHHELMRGQRELLLLYHEYALLAARDPALRERLVERQRGLRAAMGRAFATRYARTGLPLDIPGERLATAVMAMADGLSLEHLVDPEVVGEDLLEEILNLIYAGIAARSRR